MTKSKVKAVNNSVVVVIGGVEHYALPTELQLGNRKLGEILQEYMKLKREHDNLIVSHKELYEEHQEFKQEVEKKLKLILGEVNDI